MQRHVMALDKYCNNEVWHIQVRLNKKFKWHKYTDEYECRHRILDIPFKQWFFSEVFTFLLLSWYLLLVIKKKNFDIINFHIAYPLLTYWNILKPFIKKPIVLTEHWSAYHFNFGLTKNSNKLNRVKWIFKRNIPIVTVSKALAEDIKKFSGKTDIKPYIVPNVVNRPELTHLSQKSINYSAPQFFMLSGWNYPKRPFLIINAFADFLIKHPNSVLKIGGKGSMFDEMQNTVNKLGISDNVLFLGQLKAHEIHNQLKSADFFLHASDYETFSVVCAEALCSGVPVAASAVGGIKEYIEPFNGILVPENTTEEWCIALEELLTEAYYTEEIANKAAARFSSETVGELYYKSLNEILNDFQK